MLASSVALQAQWASIDSFAGMAGCWERDAKGSLISEMWMKPAGTSIFGMGRTVKGGKTTDFEMMRIEQQADGIYFIAKPKANSEETPFKLITSAAGEFVFENLQHDFPQRVIYKVNGNSLTGRVEGSENGKSKGFDFPMTRVKCN